MDTCNDQPLTCADCRAQMQEYLDETLPRVESTRMFLHVRGCDGCGRELEELTSLYAMLGALPEVPAPADFDARILQAVPYESYRAMEPLRRERVPVLLEDETLPGFLRSGVFRGAGILIGGAAAALAATGRLPVNTGVLLLTAGCLPQGLLLLQRLGRRIYLGATRRSETI